MLSTELIIKYRTLLDRLQTMQTLTDAQKKDYWRIWSEVSDIETIARNGNYYVQLVLDGRKVVR